MCHRAMRGIQIKSQWPVQKIIEIGDQAEGYRGSGFVMIPQRMIVFVQARPDCNPNGPMSNQQ